MGGRERREKRGRRGNCSDDRALETCEILPSLSATDATERHSYTVVKEKKTLISASYLAVDCRWDI